MHTPTQGDDFFFVFLLKKTFYFDVARELWFVPGNEASDDTVIYSSSVFEMKRYQRLQMSCFHQLVICGHRVKHHKYTELSC